MASDEYQRGQMDVREQENTFNSFMVVGVWSTALTSIAVLFLVLVFAMGWGVMGAVAAVFIAGLVSGLMVKLPSSWYVVLTVTCVLTLVVSAVVNVIRVVAGA